MSARIPFDDALDAAIDALRGGAPLEQLLTAWPEHAAELRAMLAPIAAATPPAAPAFDPARIAAGYWRVRGAVLDAREAQTRRWWRRPVSFASLSIPAGIVALAAIGAAGAAAGGAAAVTGHDVPAAVEQIVTLGAHGGSNAPAAPGHNGDRGNGGGGQGAGATAHAGAATEAPGSGPTHATGQPQQTQATGTIGHAHGDVFTLTAADGTAWNVNVDGKTQVTGTIANGATATVAGDVTSVTDRNLHADKVEVTSPPKGLTPAAELTPTPAGQGDGPDHTPGIPQGTPASGAAPPGGSSPPGVDGTQTTTSSNDGGTGREP